MSMDTQYPIGTVGPSFRRQLPNGMILTAISEPARQAWDPLLIVDELEKKGRLNAPKERS